MKRATVKMKKPNPLFEKWLTEWKDEALMKNPAIAIQLERALESLEKYPLVLTSGKECMVLEHFDNRLCIRLDRRLAEHKKDKAGVLENKTLASLPSQEKEKGSSQKNKTKPYIPNYRSAPYALLVTLFNKESSPNYSGDMSKAELCDEAQPLCDSSFKRPLPGSFYTAWSSMSKLVQKSLIKKYKNKFSLTEEGRDLALKLAQMRKEEGELNRKNVDQYKGTNTTSQAEGDRPSVPAKKINVASLLAPAKPWGRKKQPDIETVSEEQVEEDIVLSPGSFKIILVIDSKEIQGGLQKDERHFMSSLLKMGIDADVRVLPVGDFVWLARGEVDGRTRELVLPWVVERKTLDDLARSIKDTRFHEQKFRLKRCGLSNIIYLVEGMSSNIYHGLPFPHLMQAAINTQVNDNFTVKITANHTETKRYLAIVTTLLSSLFRNRTLFSCSKEDRGGQWNSEDEVAFLPTFDHFKTDIGKNRKLTVKEMLVKQLVQAHGISSERGWSVAEAYPSPSALISALLAGGPSALSPPLGITLAEFLHTLYTSRTFPNS